MKGIQSYYFSKEHPKKSYQKYASIFRVKIPRGIFITVRNWILALHKELTMQISCNLYTLYECANISQSIVATCRLRVIINVTS